MFGRFSLTLATHSALLKQTDLCVKCGLCLSHCPTYVKTRDEGNSPRGRIALIEGLAKGQLTPTPRLEEHLNSCLTCRACERVCPSGVRYGTIIDAGRAMIHSQSEPSALTKLVTNKPLLRLASRALRVYQRSGAQTLARASGLLRRGDMNRLDSLLPSLPPPPAWQEYYSPLSKKRGEVALFTGCIAEVTDTVTLDAAIRLLTACGYGVHVPRTQVCCGALHLHDGFPQQARRLAGQNLAAFSALKVDTVISAASGCGAQLAEYGQLLEDEQGRRFAHSVQDISQFLAGIDWPENITFSPLHQRVAIHEPCTLRNVLRQESHPYTMLRKIPGIELIALPGNAQCCGAAGTYMISQPALADSLRNDKLAALKTSGADMLVSSNIGCALHLAAGIRESEKPIEVLHPAALLARQLNSDPDKERHIP
ncbi:MAG: (Fe-S)-binding protein [Gammaproteobacteria bacterium]|nr:(Fe-S)-binding protein [Gammaproteobacteria bacterium]